MARRLNTFQKCMLDWNSMHPYNAVHIVRIAGVPDATRWEQAINGTLEARGLTGLVLDEKHGTYSYCGGPGAYRVKWLLVATDLNESLSIEIENQLNSPFKTDGPLSPFRFFGGEFHGSTFLGLVYLHAVADAEAVVVLMKQITEAYVAGSPSVSLQTASPASRRKWTFSHPGAFARKMCAFPSAMSQMRRSCRPKYLDPQDLRNAFRLFTLEAEGLVSLLRAAKGWGVTANDVLIALLLKGVASLATGREQGKRRNKISVGCIVNTRKDFPCESLDLFSLYLGAFVVTHDVPSQVSLKQLAVEVARTTRKIKGAKLYLATPLELSFGRFLLSFFSSERRKRLYQKHYPLWGGVTNMNVNPIWGMVASKRCDYLRGVSTGPATPLVMSFTTAGDSANIGLSYRSTVFSPADIDRFVTSFIETAQNLEVQG